jgi:hypothetical protein
MTHEHRSWARQREAFWWVHHEGWQRSDLNQREYCEAHNIPLKAFGNGERSSRPNPGRRHASCSTDATP